MGGIARLGQANRADDEDEDEATREARLARVRAEQAIQRWYSHKMTLMAVSFPIYAAEGRPARVNGSGSHGDGTLTSITIAHAETLPDATTVARPQIEVTTSIDPHPDTELPIARQAFGHRAAADRTTRFGDDLSDAAISLAFRASRRRQVAAAHGAPAGTAEIMVDGTPEPFTTVGDLGDLWVAVRHHHGVTITIVARAIDAATLSIEPVADPATRLLGPQPEES